MNKLLDNKIFLFGIIFLFIFNISLLYTLQKSWTNSVSNFLPIIKHIHYLKYETASGHLNLEEHLMGDINVDIQKEITTRHNILKQSTILTKKIILDADLPSEFLDKFIDIQIELQELEELTGHRLKKPQERSVGTKSDIIFDSKYFELQDSLSNFENQLTILLQKEQENLDAYFTLTIIFFIFFNTLILYLFYNIRKKSLLFHKELLEQKTAFEMIYQKSADGVLLLHENVIIDCNESLIKMLGAKTKNEVLNLHPSDISPPLQPDGEDSFTKAHKLLDTCETKDTLKFEWLHRRFNGETFMSEVLLTHIKLFNKDIIHCVLRDISERIRLEEKHEKNQQIIFEQSKMAQMGTMLSAISHQWKQPLSRINSKLIKLSTLLELDSDKQETLENNIDEIEELTSYMAETIENFRTYFNPLKEKSSFNLKIAIDKAYTLSSLKNDKSSIEFIIKCQEEMEYIGYEDELIQVLIVLINNSKEAFENKTIDKPYIRVVVLDHILSIEIIIIDNAGGIDDSIVDKVFNPYFSTKVKNRNSGIGLTMAKVIIENGMHGALRYNNINGNSNFGISLKR